MDQEVQGSIPAPLMLFTRETAAFKYLFPVRVFIKQNGGNRITLFIVRARYVSITTQSV